MLKEQNYSMLADFYEFTMANGYLKNGEADKICYFDLYFRSVPDDGGFAIMAGTEQVVEYLSNLRFEKEDIEYLRGRKLFCEEFLSYLENFRFSCDVWAMPEGTPVFPNEPLVIVRGPAIQAQLVETMLLLLVNHQTLIATKTNRIVRAAQGRAVMEFGSRRAHGASSAILGARAAYIGGCVGTANTLSDELYGIPALGTMAHSWVQMFPTEYDAFKAYAEVYPDSCTLLIDTYNVLKSGLPNAIKVFKEVIVPRGCRPKGVRIDSGDITYLTKKIRKELDREGFEDCGIVVSNSLDEYIIRDTLAHGAQINSFGVGERLITARSWPVFGGVYKLVGVEENGEIIPKIKISENPAKITTPDFKQVYRLYDNETGKAIADVMTLYGEKIDDSQPYEIFDPVHTWKRKTVTNFTARKLLVQIFRDGKQIAQLPDLEEIREYCAGQVETIWDEVKRFENPHTYYVDLSQKLWQVKHSLLEKFSK